MSTTDAAPAKPAQPKPRPAKRGGKADRLIDRGFAKLLVILNGLVPLAVLGYDACQGQLGANPVNFAIRTTGLLGLILLVLTLAVTPLRRVTGWTTLNAIRRNLGVLAFVYLALHFAIFFGYDRAASVSSTASEIVHRVYLWFGAAALLGLIPLAITSTDGMTRRLGGARWKRLHWLTFPIAGCAIIHYYLLVKSDTRQPIAFGLVIAILLAERLFRRRRTP